MSFQAPLFSTGSFSAPPFDVAKYIKDNLFITGVQIGDNEAIKAKFGLDITGVDLVIVKDSTVLAIKYKNVPPTIEDVTHFVYCCDDMSKKSGIPINKVWLTGSPIYGVPVDIMKKHNIIQVNNYNLQELANTVIANIKQMFGLPPTPTPVAAPATQSYGFTQSLPGFTQASGGFTQSLPSFTSLPGYK
jgi:hypothetical protein